MATKDTTFRKDVEKVFEKATKQDVPLMIAFIDETHSITAGMTKQTPVDALCMISDMVMHVAKELDVREHDLLKEIKRIIKAAKLNGLKEVEVKKDEE